MWVIKGKEKWGGKVSTLGLELDYHVLFHPFGSPFLNNSIWLSDSFEVKENNSAYYESDFMPELDTQR